MEVFFKCMRDRILKKVRIRPGQECCIWCGGKDTKKLYGRIGYVDPVSGDSKRKNVHRFAYMVFNEVWDVQQTLDCSHLCHNLLSVNVQHLVLEPRPVNYNRNNCKNEGRCFGHPGHRDCFIYPRLVWGLKHYITPFLRPPASLSVHPSVRQSVSL